MVSDASCAILCDWFKETQTDRGADKQIFPAAIHFLCADLVPVLGQVGKATFLEKKRKQEISKRKHVISSECL